MCRCYLKALNATRRPVSITRCERMDAAKLTHASEVSQYVIEPNRSSLVLRSDWTGRHPPSPDTPAA